MESIIWFADTRIGIKPEFVIGSSGFWCQSLLDSGDLSDCQRRCKESRAGIADGSGDAWKGGIRMEEEEMVVFLDNNAASEPLLQRLVYASISQYSILAGDTLSKMIIPSKVSSGVISIVYNVLEIVMAVTFSAVILCFSDMSVKK